LSFPSKKLNGGVVFLQHLFLTTEKSRYIIIAMPEHPKSNSEGSDKQRKQSKSDAANENLELGLTEQTIIESLPVGIVAFDANLKIITANPQAKKLIELGKYIDKSLAKGTDDKVWLGWTQQLKSAISTGRLCTFNDVGFTSEGKTKLLQIVCTPLGKGKTATNLSGIILIEDMTETINIQKQLANAEKLASIGKLASKVAHELNNPLDGILRYINLTMRILEQENLEKPQEYLKQCRQGLMRMIQIVSELLEFSRSTYAPLEYSAIEQIIEDAIKTIDAKAETLNIKVLRNYKPGMPQIRSGNLFQVFCNLAKNALDAMPDGGELRISTLRAADNSIVVKFRDTGTGFPLENSEAIFEPFFTTKETGKGTGLGLAICRDIIEGYNGRITAENASDGGSIFTIYLPTSK
jgi:nitrogen fixation/metabolism regulation signal transduction histidine kinase